MKTFILNSITILIAGILGVGVSSCGDNDDENGNRTENTGEEKDNNNNQSLDDNVSTYNRGPVAKSFRGNGTLSNPYIISDAPELRKLSDDVASGNTYRDEYFRMTADITVNRNVLIIDTMLNEQKVSTFEQWVPIGTKDTPFCGTFDGNGHTISGIFINKEEGRYLGLFGNAAGTIKHLKIKDSFIRGEKFVGGLLGHACKYLEYVPQVEDVITQGVIYGNGGIVGWSSQCAIRISHCVNFGVIKDEGACAGILGYDFKGPSTISDCANYGTIEGSNGCGIIGGISNTTLKNCVNFGVVTGKSGLLNGTSLNYNATMNNCVNYGKVNPWSNKSAALMAANWESGDELRNLYYLETSSQYAYGTKVSHNTWNIVNMTEKQMKEQSFLNELNKNAKALGSKYCLWKFGKDGFPTLEWIEGF